MCGIAGIFGPGSDLEALSRMTVVLAHRGPDDHGLWIDPDARIALGHRRLAIVDLSSAGHQPMASPAGRFVMTFNGEIYNHAELRRELQGLGNQIEWQGHSDTETLLAGFDVWGIKPTLERVLGMFALAAWDRQSRTLTLARDRLGEKPLYYGRQNGPGGSFLFASELNALRQHPAFDPEIDRDSLGLFVRYLAVPAPRSIYRGISKLLPGTLLTLREGAEPMLDQYWSGAAVASAGLAGPAALDPMEAADELERVLARAVGRQMMADVPLGAFLSGGVDSSSVVAMMQTLSSRPVKTFTVGFHEKAYNEAEYAKAVAAHLRTDHTELYVTPEQAMDVIPKLPGVYDEPFADSSQIPTYLISALAREQVTVALSGDGGDELFGGYDRYLMTSSWWNRLSRIPRPLRLLGAAGLTMTPATVLNRVGDLAGGILPRSLRMKRLGDKIYKGAGMLGSRSIDELYDSMLSMWPHEDSFVIGASKVSPPVLADAAELRGVGGAERMMAQDMLGYLPNDILAKVDRAAMAVSLETRVPLLDRELVEFAWRLPLGFKIRGGETKWLLRQVLYRHVPATLIDRPKMGFGVPLDSWMRGPLRDWVEHFLDERRLRQEGYFRPGPIREAWAAHLAGRNNQLKLWTVLMFESWLDAQKGTATTA